MIYFLGTSHAAIHLRDAAVKRGVAVANEMANAEVIFVSEDTPTSAAGKRDLTQVRNLIDIAASTGKPIVLTSQVEPGFTRSLGIQNIHHQAETLRIKDAEERAYSPEYIAVGGDAPLSPAYLQYLFSFGCPVLRMSWEDAEMSKIAVNMMLASQVEMVNQLSRAAEEVGADWKNIAHALALDKRIGPHAYLTPGNWQDSKHLLRDYVTLEALSTR